MTDVTARAQGIRIEIIRAEPAFGGRTFGRVGVYRKLTGVARGRVDPSHPSNACIVDLARAPTDAEGLVAWESPFCLLLPADPAAGNGALLYDVVNRGSKVALHALNDAPRDRVQALAMAVNDPCMPEDAGNGFLMRHGFSLLWSGWQGGGVAGDAGLLAARLPFATEGAAPLVGLSREEYVFEHARSPVTAPLSYPAAQADPAQCVLTVRQRAADPRVVVAAEHWRFVSATQIEIQRPAGFDAGAIYEFIYPARDPVVMGLGYAAIRDLVAFCRHEREDGGGTPNPFAGAGGIAIDRVLAFGISQAGRVLRDFLHLGFNRDPSGRPVFDGLLPSMTGSRKAFVNHRFAQPGRFARQHEDRLFPHDQFPFTYAVTTDRVSGGTDGLFAACGRAADCPKVVHTESSSDFFHGRASLLVTDADGRDLPDPECVRFYHFAGTQHGGGAMASLPQLFPMARHPLNPADFAGVHRALLLALDRWVSHGTPPPPSRFPRVADGTLVDGESGDYGFPAIPGVRYPGLVNGLCEVDASGQPPRVIPGHDYVVRVPAIDTDGNEIAGVRVPAIAVPRGTHTGWAVRAPGYAEDELFVLGSFFPFRQTRAERLAAGDPRPSLEERYATPAEYVRRVAEAAAGLREAGLLLEEDVERLVAAARVLA